jgi:hypothetical protein
LGLGPEDQQCKTKHPSILLSFSADANLPLSSHSLDDTSRKGKPQKKRLRGTWHHQWKEAKGEPDRVEGREGKEEKKPDPGVRDLDGAGQLDQQPDGGLDRSRAEAAPLPSSISQRAFFCCQDLSLSCRRSKKTDGSKQAQEVACCPMALRLPGVEW